VLVLLVLVLVLVVVVVALLMLVVMVVVVFEGCLTHNVTQSLSSRRGCIVFWPLRGRCRRRIAGSAMNRRSGVAATKLPNDVCSVYQCVSVLRIYFRSFSVMRASVAPQLRHTSGRHTSGWK
jgi:hypothetical protein